MAAIVAAVLVGYAVGSINPASLIARAKSIDLRSIGSGNPGATNATRAMGPRVGVVVALVDVAKGLIPAVAFGALAGPAAAEVAGLAAVVGHVTSPFLRGHGGKGVATTLGALLGATPLWAAIVLLVFGLGFAVTRRMGLASVGAGVALIIVALVLGDGWAQRLFGLCLGAIVLARHSSNIRRGRAG